MKNLAILILAVMGTVAAVAQTLNVEIGSVTYQIPAVQAGQMIYADGETVTIFNKVYDLSAVGGAPLQGLWGLLLTTILIPVLALVDIFLYKKRILQARLNIFTVLLCLGYYGVLAIYIWLAKMQMIYINIQLELSIE